MFRDFDLYIGDLYIGDFYIGDQGFIYRRYPGIWIYI